MFHHSVTSQITPNLVNTETNHSAYSPLTELPLCTWGTVKSIRGTSEQIVQLHRVGIIEGVQIQRLTSGDPMLVIVGENRLGMSAKLLSNILVCAAPA